VSNQSDYDAATKADAAPLLSGVLPGAHTGTLNITGLALGNLHPGAQPIIERLDFSVELDLRTSSGR